MQSPTEQASELGRLRDSKWLAGYLGISEDTIGRLVKANRIPVTRIDRRLRFDIVAIDKWISRHTSSPERAA